MKKVLLSAILATSLFSSVDITFDDSKITFDGTSETGTLQYMFIYKNGKFTKLSKDKYFEIDTTYDRYKAIMVMLDDNGKKSYVTKEIEVTSPTVAQNIAPVADLSYSISNNSINFDTSGSKDVDGEIVKKQVFVYKDGKYIGLASNDVFNFTEFGSYKAIISVEDDRGERTIKAINFDVLEPVEEVVETVETVETVQEETVETVQEETVETVETQSNLIYTEGAIYFGDDVSSNYTIGTPTTIIGEIYDSERKGALNGIFGFHDKIGTGAAYEQGWTGEGVKVGILDSGVDSDHPDLKDRIVFMDSVLTYSETASAGEDDFKHGTQVSGIMVGSNNDVGIQGVAYDSDLYSVKVLNQTGSGTLYQLAEGLDILNEQNVKVTNISSGTYFSLDYTQYIDSYKNAVNNDNTLVVAAGNFGTQCTKNSSGNLTGCHYPAALPLIYPELLQGTGGYIVVGSYAKDGTISSYSNTAGLMKDFFIVAPGGNTSTSEVLQVATIDGYSYAKGTSMAAPMVSGAVALLAQKYPYLEGTKIADILFASATDLGEPGVDEIFGHGALNIEAAMAPIGELKIPTKSNNTYSVSTSTISGGVVASSLSLDTLFLDEFERAFDVTIGSTEEVDPFTVWNFENMKSFYVDNTKISLDEANQYFAIGKKYNDLEFSLGYDKTVFGAEGTGATELSGSTYYLNMSYSFDNIHTSLTTGYSNPNVGGLYTDSSQIVGVSSDIHYAKQSKNWNFKLGVQTPMQVVYGSINAELPSVNASSGDLSFNQTNLSLINNIDYRFYLKSEYKF